MSTQQPYFIGIALPQELSGHIFSFAQSLHVEIDYTLKPLVPHITLLHPSSLCTSPQGTFLPKVRQAAASYLPLTITLNGINAFRREVLYIGVHSPELEALQHSLVELLPPDSRKNYKGRPYTPHITLGQTRAPHTLDIEVLTGRAGKEIPAPPQLTVDSLSYFTQIRPREYRSNTL